VNINATQLKVFSTYFRIIDDPTKTKAPPVAHPGIDENIGAKKTDIKKARPTTIPVIPVFPPSAQKLRFNDGY
jgi:hypothetical protein